MLPAPFLAENTNVPIPGYQLSYLTKQEQAELWDIIQSECCTPSLSQAVRLKRQS